MKPRCRSVFQNYQHFQAWQDGSQYNCANLLQRLNTNLNTYENKYKKYMNFQQNQIKNTRKLQPLLPPLQKHQDNLPISSIQKTESQSIAKSQNIVTQKIFISEQKQLKDSDIFCERTNLLLKHKTLCFEKNTKQSNSLNRRKLSGHDQKYPQIEKIMIQCKKHHNQQKQNLTQSFIKIESLKKCGDGYKKLRYRLKKAANRSKLFHEQKTEQYKEKQNVGNLFLKKRFIKIRQSIQKNIQQPIEEKINQFSDKKFYESTLKQRYLLHR